MDLSIGLAGQNWADNATHENLFAGIPLGILVGIVTGVIFVSLVRLLLKGDTTQAIFPVISRLFLLPAFWVGGNFLTGALLAGQIDEIRSSYLTSLVVSFVLVVGYPVAVYDIREGSALGNE